MVHAPVLEWANRHDVTQIIKLVDGIPEIKGKVGRPLHKPKVVQGDRGYDSESKRKALKKREIRPELAKRRTPHGSGLGKTRWVVERSIAWLHDFRRLQIRYERTVPIHRAFVFLGCAMIAFRRLGI